ncbi:SDR family NAD(P)-dependent oxidoreductase [Paraburkholderia azotifigens]|uniref:SDR family NAD(P)-dependent oxidoreductase n=1 Tax=Paraburkholderia azotifigens TaxID=2057004 RepID=UPI00317A14AC
MNTRPVWSGALSCLVLDFIWSAHRVRPESSIYSELACKFALEGISEALAKEVRPFGIFVTAVAPGSFRTDWAGRSMIRSPRSIPDYDPLFDPIRKAREEKSGKQLGDPVKAARAMLSLIGMDNPPTHLLLGSDALGLVRDKLSALKDEIDA